MVHVLAHNATRSPVIVDGQGHVLGGGEYGPVRDNASEVKAAVERGQLTIVEVPEGVTVEQLAPEVVAGLEETARRNGDEPAEALPASEASRDQESADKPARRGGSGRRSDKQPATEGD